jgi:hypothetical protein
MAITTKEKIMNKFSRMFLFCALALVLLTAACASEEGTPTAAETLLPVDLTPSPAVTDDGTLTAETETPSTTETLEVTETTTPEAAQLTPTADGSQTPSIPVTGDEVILLECQFCVDNMAHALLVISEAATFELVTTAAGADTGCNTVDTFNGKQVVLCRAEENTSITVNICTDGTNCTELLVDLQACPVSANTPEPGGVTNTPEPGAATATDTPEPSPTTGGVTSTPTP